MRHGLVTHEDGLARCWWAGTSADYVAYHDAEWGRPVRDDVRLFEKLCLEGFQSGLSWLTILRKREAFRRAFRGFDPVRVRRMGARDVERLMKDASIVRNRAKIESTIQNAGRVLEVIDEHGSFARYVWQWVPPEEERPKKLTKRALVGMAVTPTSKALSRDLKKRGFSFVGPTTVYAFMQAMGLVNDHLDGCAFRTRAATRHDRRG